jgi:hypothetical protein
MKFLFSFVLLSAFAFAQVAYDDGGAAIGLDHNHPYRDSSGGALCCVIAPLDF